MANKTTALQQFIYLKHQPIAKLEDKQLIAIHSDHLGTPRIATNDKKETVWKANYSPFGKATLETNKITLNLRLPGQYHDNETGTHYNYLRDYDPETGRYVTSDPIGLAGGINIYGYVDNDPLGWMDTKGLFYQPVPNFPDFSDMTVLDRVEYLLDAFGGKSAVAGVLDPNVTDMLGHLGPEIMKEIKNQIPEIEFSQEVVATIALGVAAILNIGNIFDKLGGKLAKNPWGLALKYAGKALAGYYLFKSIVDGIDGAKGLVDTVKNQITDLETLKLKTDGSIDWSSAENCARIQIAGTVIGSQAAGLIKAGKGNKIFGRKKDRGKCKKPAKEPSTTKEHKECYKTIARLNELKLSDSQLNEIEKALGNKGSYCGAGKFNY